jgi:hypothetical protein
MASERRLVPGALLEALSSLVPVDFRLVSDLDWTDYDGALFIGVPERNLERLCRGGGRSLAVPRDSETRPCREPEADVQLSNSAVLEECLRGRTLPDPAIEEVRLVERRPGDVVLARKGVDPLWIYREVGGSQLHLVAMDLPSLHEQEYLYHHLQKDRWARLLPLLHFVLDICAWQRPGVRACFMFDDPNLHWRSYGYVDYRELAEHARLHNYHVSIATVPMDSWYVDRRAAEVFRNNSDRLSLVVHGNDHTAYELVRPKTDADRNALAAQAMNRTARLERRANVKVARAMTAPHGACDHSMGSALLRSGFDAACISRSSLLLRNPDTKWPVAVGLRPAEFLGDGLPVLPRFNIRWDFTSALFAAFLGQPIVLVGHHDDLACGLSVLEKWAGSINTMGSVRWTDVTGMVDTNFVIQVEDEVLDTWMFARKVSLDVPSDVRHVRVHLPWPTRHPEDVLWLMNDSMVAPVRIYEGQLIPTQPGQRLVIESRHLNQCATAPSPARWPTLWAVARRQLCEVRDRLRPGIDGLRRLKPNGLEAERIVQRNVA